MSNKNELEDLQATAFSGCLGAGYSSALVLEKQHAFLLVKLQQAVGRF